MHLGEVKRFYVVRIYRKNVIVEKCTQHLSASVQVQNQFIYFYNHISGTYILVLFLEYLNLNCRIFFTWVAVALCVMMRYNYYQLYTCIVYIFFYKGKKIKIYFIIEFTFNINILILCISINIVSNI